jgi:Icc-related predicted phosphoesterase
MRIVQISDTHNRHQWLKDLPAGDVIVHCGDFSDMGREEEVLDFLNWFIMLPYDHKIFVTGNHDLCLWDAEDIEDLPENVHFLQDRSCEIDGIRFFGLAYNHPESLIPDEVDVLITHEPPIMILDETVGIHWGNSPLRNRVFEVKPKYHLFGHAHEAYGEETIDGITFSNGSSLNDNYYEACHKPRIIEINGKY